MSWPGRRGAAIVSFNTICFPRNDHPSPSARAINFLRDMIKNYPRREPRSLAPVPVPVPVPGEENQFPAEPSYLFNLFRLFHYCSPSRPLSFLPANDRVRDRTAAATFERCRGAMEERGFSLFQRGSPFNSRGDLPILFNQQGEILKDFNYLIVKFLPFLLVEKYRCKEDKGRF